MRCVLLPGGVFRGTAIRDFEAESVSDVNLSTDKRGDMLCLSGVLHRDTCKLPWHNVT